MTFLDTIKQAGELPQAPTLAPPMFYWLHGTRVGKNEVPGVFYVKETELLTPPEAPWQPDDRFNDERGFSTEMLTIAFIARREQWYIPSDRPNGPPTWLNEYQEGVGASCRTEWLCFVQGIPGPCLYRSEKWSKTKTISEGIKTYRRGMLRHASIAYGRSLPLWAFWLPFTNPRDKDGKLIVERVKLEKGGEGAPMTPPTLTLPDASGLMLLDALYVGNELLQEGFNVWKQYQSWQYERNRNRDDRVTEGTVIDQTRALPAAGGSSGSTFTFTEEDLPF